MDDLFKKTIEQESNFNQEAEDSDYANWEPLTIRENCKIWAYIGVAFILLVLLIIHIHK